MLESMMKSSDFKGNMKLTLIQIQMKILMWQLQIQVGLKNFFSGNVLPVSVAHECKK